MVKISIEKISNFLKKYYFWILGVVFILLICFNFFIYYKYIYLLIRTEPSFIVNEITINNKTLQKILDNIEIREENLLRVQTNEYPDPFN